MEAVLTPGRRAWQAAAVLALGVAGAVLAVFVWGLDTVVAASGVGSLVVASGAYVLAIPGRRAEKSVVVAEPSSAPTYRPETVLDDPAVTPETKDLYRKAIDGDADAMNSLANWLDDRDDGVYRRAADKDDVYAMYNLGRLLKLRGDSLDAEHWFRKASDAGDVDAMNHIGVLLNARGDGVGAEHLYRKAIEAGEADWAKYNLGRLLLDRGGAEREAETWLRSAAEEGCVDAMVKLGDLLRERGDLDGAEPWYRRAVDAGSASAAVGLGLVYDKRDDSLTEEQWYRKAIELDDDAWAMNNLGIVLEDRGDPVGAEHWFRKSAEAGNANAMTSLAALL